MLTVVLVLALLGTPTVAAAIYSGGSGTEGDPCLISTQQDLLDLANTANSADWDEHFLMTNDIDMEGITGFTHMRPHTDPDTSGLQGAKFTGVSDGGNAKSLWYHGRRCRARTAP